MSISPTPYPNLKITSRFILLILVAMAVALKILLSVDDPIRLKALIEDDGPIQLVGQTAIALAFALALFYSIADKLRYSAYLNLSYLLMFYTLREADYHYKLSEYAKATQFKRFFSHELIPLSSKLFLASIVILFFVVLYRYYMSEKKTFLMALKAKLPWAIFAGLWALIFFISQAIDQTSYFHNLVGQVYEEVFETSAEIIALCSMILFRVQLRSNSSSI